MTKRKKKHRKKRWIYVLAALVMIVVCIAFTYGKSETERPDDPMPPQIAVRHHRHSMTDDLNKVELRKHIN